MKSDPPDYFESIVNQEINPQLNKNWAKHLHEKSVAPEIDEVINRYRFDRRIYDLEFNYFKVKYFFRQNDFQFELGLGNILYALLILMNEKYCKEEHFSNNM